MVSLRLFGAFLILNNLVSRKPLVIERNGPTLFDIELKYLVIQGTFDFLDSFSTTLYLGTAGHMTSYRPPPSGIF